MENIIEKLNSQLDECLCFDLPTTHIEAEIQAHKNTDKGAPDAGGHTRA